MKYDETLVVVRSLNKKAPTKYDFYFSNAPCGTTIKEFARAWCMAAHRIEEAIKRGKSGAGLWHYEVRNWRGWHHHQVLSLIATWFLVREAQRGEKLEPQQSPCRRSATASPCFCERLTSAIRRPKSPTTKQSVAPQRRGEILSLQST